MNQEPKNNQAMDANDSMYLFTHKNTGVSLIATQGNAEELAKKFDFELNEDHWNQEYVAEVWQILPDWEDREVSHENTK